MPTLQPASTGDDEPPLGLVDFASVRQQGTSTGGMGAACNPCWLPHRKLWYYSR